MTPPLLRVDSGGPPLMESYPPILEILRAKASYSLLRHRPPRLELPTGVRRSRSEREAPIGWNKLGGGDSENRRLSLAGQ